MAPVKTPQSKARSRKDGSAIPLDETDKRLMNLLQSNFPLDPEPFAPIAAAAELQLDDVLARTRRLLEGRIIREITPIFDTRALGYESMLVAAKVDADNPQRAAAAVNAHPGVSHNYLRTHDFNLWFTIAVPPDSELGMDGHSGGADARDGRRVDAPAPHPDPVQDQHEPGDGEGHRGARRPGRGGAAARARAPALRRAGHRDDPRAAGADGGDRAPLRRGRGRARDLHRGAAGAAARDGRAQAAAPRRRDPLPSPRRLLGQRHGGLEGAGGGDPRDRPPHGLLPRHLPLLPAADLRGLALQRLHDGPRSLEGGVRRDPRLDRRRVRDGAGRPRDPLLLDRVQEDPPALLHRRLRAVGS